MGLVRFQRKVYANRFLCLLQDKLRKFDLALHPDNIQLIRFDRYAEKQYQQRGAGHPATFDFLGFTHHCKKARKGGWFMIGRKTAKKHMRAQL